MAKEQAGNGNQHMELWLTRPARVLYFWAGQQQQLIQIGNMDWGTLMSAKEPLLLSPFFAFMATEEVPWGPEGDPQLGMQHKAPPRCCSHSAGDTPVTPGIPAEGRAAPSTPQAWGTGQAPAQSWGWRDSHHSLLQCDHCNLCVEMQIKSIPRDFWWVNSAATTLSLA